MEKVGLFTRLENLHVVSFQFFDAFKESPNYRHKVQLRNQKQRVYFERQTVTLIEVNKFLKQKEKFAGDNSRIAQWLRAIDTLNREADFSEFAADPVFKVLQNEVKLNKFRQPSSGWLLDYHFRTLSVINEKLFSCYGKHSAAWDVDFPGEPFHLLVVHHGVRVYESNALGAGEVHCGTGVVVEILALAEYLVE